MGITSKQPVAPEDLLRFHIPGDVQLTPDGERVVWTERYVDRDTMTTYCRLVGGTCGSMLVSLTDGQQRDSTPRWAPDGERLLFVRSGIEGRERVSQLCLWTDGGVRVLAEREGSFGPPSWSPDGTTAVLAMRLADPVADGDNQPVAIEVRRLHYKQDGEGYLPQDRYSLYTIDTTAPGAELVRLTADGDWDDSDPVFSPDGAHVAFLSGRRDDRDHDFEHRDVYVMPTVGGPARRLTPERMYAACPSWSPDGTWIAFIGCVGTPFSALFLKNVEVMRADVDGSGASRLTSSLDRCTMNLTIDDLWGIAHWEQKPAFVDGGRRLLFPVSNEGTTWLAALDLDDEGNPTGELQRVVDDVVVVTTSVANTKLAMITTSAQEPGRIVRANLDGSERETVGWPLADYCAQTHFADPIEIRIDREDAQVHGWLALPEGDGPHPLLLSIHGGPIVQFGANFFHEIQCQVASGFAVLFVNPRGSQGYGAKWASATHLDWGTQPMADLMAAVDEAVRNHPIDPERMGVLGGSYGGYMATWIVARDHRFKAACAQRTVSSMDALFWADFGVVIQNELEAWPWEDPERYRRMSPLTYAADIQTPMLIMQGLGDLRTPADQGERLFVTLRALGKDAEMVLFPGASHSLSRSGPPRQRLERLRRIDAWFRKHLFPE